MCRGCGYRGHLQKFCRKSNQGLASQQGSVAAPSPQNPSQNQSNFPQRTTPPKTNTPAGTQPTVNRGNNAAGASNSGKRLYEMVVEDQATAPMTRGMIYHRAEPIDILFDSGATHSFVSQEVVDRLSLESKALDDAFVVGLPNGDI